MEIRSRDSFDALNCFSSKRLRTLLARHVQQKGRTVVPLELYFKRGWAKLSLGLAEGKQLYDKRDTIKKRDQQRDIDRDLRGR